MNLDGALCKMPTNTQTKTPTERQTDRKTDRQTDNNTGTRDDVLSSGLQQWRQSGCRQKVYPPPLYCFITRRYKTVCSGPTELFHRQQKRTEASRGNASCCVCVDALSLLFSLFPPDRVKGLLAASWVTAHMRGFRATLLLLYPTYRTFQPHTVQQYRAKHSQWFGTPNQVA